MSRSYKDVEEHALRNGDETVNGNRLVTKYQLFSLQHRGDLLEHCPASDISEMKALLYSTLKDISGAGLALIAQSKLDNMMLTSRGLCSENRCAVGGSCCQGEGRLQGEGLLENTH